MEATEKDYMKWLNEHAGKEIMSVLKGALG